MNNLNLPPPVISSTEKKILAKKSKKVNTNISEEESELVKQIKENQEIYFLYSISSSV